MCCSQAEKPGAPAPLETVLNACARICARGVQDDAKRQVGVPFAGGAVGAKAIAGLGVEKGGGAEQRQIVPDLGARASASGPVSPACAGRAASRAPEI